MRIFVRMGVFTNLFRKEKPINEIRLVDSQNLINLINGISGNGKTVSVSPKTAVNIGVVFECLDLITRTLSLVSPKVFQSRDKAKIIDYNNPYYNLVNRQPYPLYDASKFYGRLIVHYLLYGNGYAEIIRNGSRVQGFKIHRPENVDVVVIETDNGLQEHSYKVSNDTTKDKSKIVLQKDMIHLMDFSLDGVKGISRITTKQDTLKNAGNIVNYATQMYENGANISGILKGDRIVEKGALDYFRQKFEEQVTSKNGGIAALPPGFTYDALKYNLPFADAQILEAGKWSVEDVARIFGVPLSLIGRGESADNKAEREFNTFLTTTIAPLCLLIECEFNRKLFPDKTDTYIKFELKGLYRVDMKTRYESHQIALNSGFMNKDEVRYIEDMNAIDGGYGATYYQQLNTIPLDKAEKYFDDVIDSGKSKEKNNDNTGV